MKYTKTIFSPISYCLPTLKKPFGLSEAKGYPVVFTPDQSRTDPSSSDVEELAEIEPPGHVAMIFLQAIDDSINELSGSKEDGALAEMPKEESLISSMDIKVFRSSQDSSAEEEELATTQANIVSSSSTKERDAVVRTFRRKLEEMGYGDEVIECQMKNEEKMWQLCTIFPEHQKFKKDTLVRLWMGRELNDDLKRLNYNTYFDALVTEGCIECTNQCFPSIESMYKVNAAKMNIVTSCQKKYLKLNASDLLTNNSIAVKLENLSLVCDRIDESIFNELMKLKNLKTLILFPHEANGRGVTIKIPDAFFLNLKDLQVLDLSGVCITDLPSSIWEANKLQYLDLSNSMFELLPETIGCLQRLQTLKLRDCVRLQRLPEEIAELTSLRHLDINVLGQFSFLPSRMGNITALETLSAFIVDYNEGRRISELKHMDDLSGSFCISNLDRVSSENEAEEACLSRKKNLKTIKLRWSVPRLTKRKQQQHDRKVLEQLYPPSSLEDLEISGYAGSKFPAWLGNSEALHRIVNITLVACIHTNLLPSLGELPLLKNLHLIDINRVKKIGNEFRGDVNVAFPALESLTIEGMSRLETWNGVKDIDFPRVSKVIIEHCPKLTALPSLSCLHSLKQLEISQCTKLSNWSNTEFPSSLETLMVENCPSFKKRYGKSNSKALVKVMHVKNMWIDQEEIINANDLHQVL